MKRIHLLVLGLFIAIPMCISILAFSEPEMPKIVSKIETVQKEKRILKIPYEKGVQYGKASYYGERWNGRTTANMEIYDCDSLTCASPTLPFNTNLKVTNLDNNKFVIIRVNDRGPYKMDKQGKALKPLIPHPKRILDLSRKSFESIGDLKEGLLNIKYEIVG